MLLRRAARATLLVGVLTASPALTSPALTEPRSTWVTMDDVPRVGSYRLRASLDAARHRVQGSGSITLVNHTTVALDHVYVHLYLNAFKNSETLFARSPWRSGRSGSQADEWGYCRVEHWRVQGRDLWPTRQYALSEDETDVRLELPEQLAPGEQITFEVAFTSQLPGIVERTGFSHDFHLVAQWFPKLARLRSDGTWAHFAFDPQAEFHADFGDYDVELEVPKEFVVGASGRLQEELTEGDRKRLRHRAEAVHDFAWTAWPRFRVHEQDIDGIGVRVLYPEGHERNLERTLAALSFGLPHFQSRYGHYPYGTLTVVHPPAHGRNAGGMEYPGFITTGGPWYASWFSRSVELVTLHELAHQWFYGLLASDEVEHPFLDEGLASYAELVAAEEWLGASGAADFAGLSLSVEALHRVSAARVAGDQPINTRAADYASFAHLGGLAYSRTAILLRTLAKTYGEDGMREALSEYSRVHRFRHPEPEDLVAAIGAALGEEARERAAAGLFERATVDYRVAALDSRIARGKAGWFGDADTPLESHDAGTRMNRALVVRRGVLAFPVTVELTTEAGDVTHHHWDGRGDYHEIVLPSSSDLASVRVDPEGAIPLDHDPRNNLATVRPGSRLRLRERIVSAAQWLLAVLGP